MFQLFYYNIAVGLWSFSNQLNFILVEHIIVNFQQKLIQNCFSLPKVDHSQTLISNTVLNRVSYNILTSVTEDTVFMLLLHSLSDILIHSASSNTIYVAVLKKEQLLTEQSNTARSNQPPKAEVITIDDDDDTDLSSSVINQSTSQGQMDFFPSADVSVVSETSGHVETSGAANTVPSGSSHVTQITLGMLSTALQNVNQSLRIASDKPVSEVTKEPNSQSDKDAIVGLPGEKKPRLESCETVTLQQTTFPQDIHDKLHSNIK